MSLRLWLPLNGDLHNQGLDDVTVTTTGTITWNNSGKIGKGFDINGGYVRYTVPSMVGTNIFSVSFWYKPISNESITANWNKILVFTTKKTDGTEGALFRFESSYNGGTSNTHAISVHNNVGEPIASVEHTLTGEWNKWHHIVAASDGTNMYTYCDNVLIRTSKCNGGTLAGSVYVGYSGTRPNGIMNDVRVYDHCLSTKEVKELSKGLVLHYPLNRGGFGQDNLLKGSKDFSGTWVNGSSWTTSDEEYKGFTVKEKSSVWGGITQNIPCSNGDIFTISFYAKVESGGRICSVHRSSLGNVTTGLTILDGNFSSGTDWVNATDDATQWKKYWATVRIDSSDITYLQWRIENSISGKKLSICGMKIEEGSIATPWVPNSADTLYSSMGLDDNIEYDVSGYQNNGTITGSLTYSSDTPRYMVSTVFDSGMNIESVNPLVTCSEFTITGWINLTTGYAVNNGFHLMGFDGTYCRICISKDSKAVRILLTNGTTNYMGGSTMEASSLVAGEWNHYTVTFDNGSIKVYINGILDSTATATITSITFPSNHIRIGRHGTEQPKGKASDIRFYATALSADDILALYNTPTSIASNGTLLTQGEISEV